MAEAAHSLMAAAAASGTDMEAIFREMVRPLTKNFHNKTYAAIDPSRPELSNRGKTAVVAGASPDSIGAACAMSLAKSGIDAVALLARNEGSLNQTKTAVEDLGLGTRVVVYAVDMADAAAVKKALADFAGTTDKKKVDILVASAGYLPDLESIEDSDAEDWWKGFEVNVRGRFNLLRAFGPVAAKGGVVIHITTAAIHMGYMPGYSSYRASNSAATKMFEYFGNEHPELRVVQVHPGLIRTPLTHKFAPSSEGIPWDDAELSGDFVNWATSSEAAFLKDRLVHANWDVEELMQMKEDVEKDPFLFVVTLKGWA
ncbi:Short chain dehydrogenase citE [Apiospora arundinis]|uniref:Short chain dehydrogenase citE n=1 Tax=Apiospora arundinis TaxID=335852 RepID=A0ABR2IAL9_9PEZI